MAKKSSDATPVPEPVANTPRASDAAVYMVASDPSFYERVHTECSGLPAQDGRFPTVDALIAALAGERRISLAFVMLIEPGGQNIDIHALRRLRLEYPQLVILAILEECDQQSSLRLQSIGVQSILLPPFAQIDVAHEIETALPNVPRFKRHPDLMRRGSARMDFLIPSDLSYVLGINHEISLLLKEFGFPPQDVRVNIPLACDEAITNAIVHGNGSAGEKKVNVQIYISHSRFRIRVRDQGNGFDADAVANPLDQENLLKAGGRGVYLMRNIMDSVEYKDGGRVLELEKRNTNSDKQRGNGEE